MAGLIYKICHPQDWAAAKDVFTGSEKDKEDGFIHFSTAEQLPGTLARYYADANALILVAVYADALGAALRFEASTGGALYPHLYADLPLTAVAWSAAISKGIDGVFVLPPACI
jgi:uncharacterized protein (DUF952 family)